MTRIAAVAVIAVIAAMAGLASSCSGDTAPRGASPGHAATEGDSPRRVVVLAPAAAEMMQALGVLDRVVGIGEFGPWPGDLGSLPQVGGYDAPNVERVLTLEADLLLTSSSEAGAGFHERLSTLGVAVLALDTSTYDGVFRSLLEVGRTFSLEDAARDVESEMRRRMREIADLARDLPRREVLFVVGRDPLYVAGPGSHIDEMIAIAGGTNVAHDALAPYQQLSMEAILERGPDVIIDTSDNHPGAPRGRDLGYWKRWPFLPAVRDGNVFLVEPGKLVIPGMRMEQMTRLMAQLIHPEVFGEPAAAAMGDDASRLDGSERE